MTPFLQQMKTVVNENFTSLQATELVSTPSNLLLISLSAKFYNRKRLIKRNCPFCKIGSFSVYVAVLQTGIFVYAKYIEEVDYSMFKVILLILFPSLHSMANLITPANKTVFTSSTSVLSFINGGIFSKQ